MLPIDREVDERDERIAGDGGRVEGAQLAGESGHHREDQPAEDHLETRGDKRSAGQSGAA